MCCPNARRQDLISLGLGLASISTPGLGLGIPLPVLVLVLQKESCKSRKYLLAYYYLPVLTFKPNPIISCVEFISIDNLVWDSVFHKQVETSSSISHFFLFYWKCCVIFLLLCVSQQHLAHFLHLSQFRLHSSHIAVLLLLFIIVSFSL